MLAVVAGASVFLLSGALSAGAATPCAGSVLAGSNFEIDTNANLKVDGPADCIDWLTDGSGSAMRAGVITKNDLPTGATDNSFGQGSQENDINPTIVTGSIPPNKSDLKTFGLYTEGGTTPQFLELFWTLTRGARTLPVSGPENRGRCMKGPAARMPSDGSRRRV